MRSSMQACDCKDIKEWYDAEISKTYYELIDVNKRLYPKIKAYNKHMLANTEKAYALTKRESLADRVRLTKEYKQDYKALTQEYLAIASLYTRKLFLLDTLDRLKRDRKWDYEQSRNKDN